MLNFVLIHGSWHTGEHWAPVINHLKSKGHAAFAPTVLGHGKGVEKRVNHLQQVKDLVQQIERQNIRDFIAVGHSYGGTVIPRLAEEIPDRIRRLVFWNAFLPERGHSLNDEVPPPFYPKADLYLAAIGEVRCSSAMKRDRTSAVPSVADLFVVVLAN